MLDPLSGGVNVLKGANQMSKDLGGIVGDQQAAMENAVRDQHKKRMEAAARKAYEQSIEEFKAFEAYEKQKSHEKEVARIKAQAMAKYGNQAWNEIGALKLKLRKEKEQEEELMDADRHKVQELFWWCMTVAALITYFFKLYK